ncbi:EAL domain-containing protein [Solicola sp. PLA-1-18]|uniref:sensor domain-containing phosphodiesterase n=1 Tax=Solicola sp. PLA-1-18 TaxID=3380532 RepID=UPI003B81D267
MVQFPPPGLRSIYQPVVDLHSGEVVGYEALIRGPVGGPGESAAAVLSSATSREEFVELDWLCRISAARGALEADLAADLALFLNTEPASFAAQAPRSARLLHQEYLDRKQPVVVEVTERNIASDPRALLHYRDLIRRNGWLLAIDDVGSDLASIALMPLIDPDVIKLDMSMVRNTPGRRTAQIVSAVQAHVERSDAIIVAEGIETDRQLDLARSLGARLGQGWLLGRPAPLPTSAATSTRARVDDSTSRRHQWRRPVDNHDPVTPWALVSGHPAVRTATAPLIRALSAHVADQTRGCGISTVVLVTGPGVDDATVYRDIAQRAFMVGILGPHASGLDLDRVRTVDLEPDDLLARHHCVVVVMAQFAVALLAVSDQAVTPNSEDQEFKYVLTYDRDIVVSAARILLRRISGADDSLPV